MAIRNCCPVSFGLYINESTGFPIGTFTTNRWVTGETWYDAEAVIEMLDSFSIDHAHPNLAVNQWITVMFRSYKSEMVELILMRDRKIKQWREIHLEFDMFEDRKLEVTSYQAIDIDSKTNTIKEALKKA